MSTERARIGIALLVLGGVCAAAPFYPLGGVWLILGLAIYAALLWRFPAVALPAVLGSLPLLDLSPWSGWLYLNEFDFVVAVTLALWLLRTPVATTPPALSAGAKWTVALVAGSFLASALLGLWPLSSLDGSLFFTPYGGLSALGQLKGFLWALALLPLLTEEARDSERLMTRCTAGMLLGLTGVVAVILWQRMLYTGLLNFVDVYRVEGPFPELHTGGGDVHAYLVTALPFTVAWVAARPTVMKAALGGALFVLATYAVGVTFTRGGYVGYAVVFVVLVGVLARLRSQGPSARLAGMAAAALLVGAGIVVLLPIVSSTFMEARLAGTQAEATTRTRHWARAIAMMDNQVTTALLGMGLGRFPRTVVFKQPEAASATFSFEHEGDNRYLRLGTGRPLYLDQRVATLPGERYVVAMDLRSPDATARVDAMLCEKSIQYSFRCRAVALEAPSAGSWRHAEATLESGDVGSGWPARPVAVSLANLHGRSVVDVDNVRLVDHAGRNLITNGDFTGAGKHWFFAADDHLPWHIFNLWVEILFEQGWLGVIAVAGLVLLAIRRTAVSMWRGDLRAGVLLASLAGFLAVGITESLFDGPRVTTLFFLLAFLALGLRSSPVGTGAPSRDEAGALAPVP